MNKFLTLTIALLLTYNVGAQDAYYWYKVDGQVLDTKRMILTN